MRVMVVVPTVKVVMEQNSSDGDARQDYDRHRTLLSLDLGLPALSRPRLQCLNLFTGSITLVSRCQEHILQARHQISMPAAFHCSIH